jgi:hypothetical protein
MSLRMRWLLSSIFFFFIVHCAYSEEIKNRWKFTNISPLQVNDSNNEGSYTVELQNLDTPEWGSQSLNKGQLQRIAEYFNVESIEELAGKEFKAENVARNPWVWLEQLAVRTKVKGEYVTPQPDELYDRAARAFAQMQLPDFSDVYERDIYSSFEPLFADDSLSGSINKDWLNQFMSKVFEYSNGDVTLSLANPSEFHMLLRCCAAYLKLENKKTEEVKRLIMSRSSEPFKFDSESAAAEHFEPVLRSNIPRE